MAEFDAGTLAEQAVLLGPGHPRAGPRGPRRRRGRLARGACPRRCSARGCSPAGRSTSSRRGRPPASSSAAARSSSTSPRGPSPASTAAAGGGQPVRSPSRSSASGSSADPAAVSRFNKEAEAGMKLVHPNIVQILDYGEQDKQALHDHGVRRGLQPPRLPQDPRPAAPETEALPLMIGLAAGLKYSLEHGRDPPRHQGDQHPDRLQRRGQARRLRPGDDRGATTRRWPPPTASAPSTTRPWSGPAAAPRGTRGPTSSSSAASSTRCSPASSPCPRSRARTRSPRCSSGASAPSSP